MSKDVQCVYWYPEKYEIGRLLHEQELAKEKELSKIQKYIGSYIHHPDLQVKLEIEDDVVLELHAVIDTGSTYNLLSDSIASKYYDLSSIEPQKITIVDGNSKIYPITQMRLQIPNHHTEGRGFKLNIHAAKTPQDDNYPVDIILGLPFLEKCISFWLDAKNKVFQLEFWS